MSPWCPPPTQGRQSPDFSQDWEAAAINEDGKAGEGGKAQRQEEGALSSSLSWDWQRKVTGRERQEMWLKGTGEGAAARVMSECVPAPTLLLLTVSEC